ncbi:hypothetical protein D3C75_768740 [compost metagenome]
MALFELFILHQLEIKVALELHKYVMGGSTLGALGDKEKGFAVSRQYPNHPSIEHAWQIPQPGAHDVVHIDLECLWFFLILRLVLHWGRIY